MDLCDGSIPIRQSIAEGIQRLTGIVPVGPVPHGVVCKIWHLIQCFVAVESHRELTRGGYLAKEQVSHSLSTARTGIPAQ